MLTVAAQLTRTEGTRGLCPGPTCLLLGQLRALSWLRQTGDRAGVWKQEKKRKGEVHREGLNHHNREATS